MSTRCTLTVRDAHNAFSVYRHFDGYPDGDSGVIADLKNVLPYAWELPRFEADDFAAAIVSCWKIKGGNIYLTGGRDSHGDTNYHYDITCVSGRVLVQVYHRGNGAFDDWKLQPLVHCINETATTGE